jgi:hypothetical protein
MPVSPSASLPAAKPRTWGGRRPGAGAPKGNLNHLKHGFDSMTISMAALMISTFPEVHRLFEAIVNTTDRSRYRQLLANARHGRRHVRGKPILYRDSIKSDIAFAVMRRLDRIQELEEFFSKHARESRQSSRLERFFQSVKRTHPELYAEWFGPEYENENDDR